MKLIKSNVALKEYCLNDFLINKTKKEKANIKKEFFDLSNIESGEYFKKDIKNVPIEIKSDLICVEKGDLIYGKCRPNLDKAILVDNEGQTTTEALVYLSEYAGFVLSIFHSLDFITYNINNSTGSKMPRTSNKNVLNYKFKAPININFEKTGNYLLSFAEHIQNIKNLIKKIETRNQYYAEKILSGELLVKKNENGLLDIYENTKWENATINNLIKKVPFEFKISKIKDKFKEFPKSKIKAGDAKNINNGKYPFFNCSDKQSLFFNEYIINDEVLYLSTGGKPAIHYFNGKASYSTDVWAIAFDKDIINKYAYYYIKHNIKTLNHCFNGAALKHLNKNDFRNIDIIYPNHNEQILIINLLDNLESEISSLQKILEKEQLRFQWLLDNLLSGEYQVVDE